MFYLIRKLIVRWHHSRYVHWKRLADQLQFGDKTSLRARMSLNEFLLAESKAEYHLSKLRSIHEELTSKEQEL